jgi:hypothetical protein
MLRTTYDSLGTGRHHLSAWIDVGVAFQFSKSRYESSRDDQDFAYRGSFREQYAATAINATNDRPLAACARLDILDSASVVEDRARSSTAVRSPSLIRISRALVFFPCGRPIREVHQSPSDRTAATHVSMASSDHVGIDNSPSPHIEFGDVLRPIERQPFGAGKPACGRACFHAAATSLMHSRWIHKPFNCLDHFGDRHSFRRAVQTDRPRNCRGHFVGIRGDGRNHRSDENSRPKVARVSCLLGAVTSPATYSLIMTWDPDVLPGTPMGATTVYETAPGETSITFSFLSSAGDFFTSDNSFPVRIGVENTPPLDLMMPSVTGQDRMFIHGNFSPLLTLNLVLWESHFGTNPFSSNALPASGFAAGPGTWYVSELDIDRTDLFANISGSVGNIAEVTTVPEPSTLVLCSLGCLALCARQRR